MNKIAKNIAGIIGFLCCLVVFILNVVYVSRIADVISENISTKFYGIFNFLLTFLLAISILVISKKLDTIKINKKVKVLIFILFLVIYIVGQICWINLRQATPAYDQRSVYTAALKMYNGDWEELTHSQYLELYPQQLTLATVYVAIFKLFGSTNVILLQYLNVIANAITVIALLLISKQLEKEYKVNKTKTFILIGTFFTLPLLSTFVYGDISSIPMCFLSIYFAMKYGMESKKRYIVLSAIFMSIGYILRMNNLIYIIALLIYFILNIMKGNEKNVKNIFLSIIMIVLFIAIAILPASTIKSTLQNKLELDKNKQYPTLGFLYIGMQESYRANGWYSDYGTWAWDDIEASKGQYEDAIKERISYFVQHPKYFVKFYGGKIASMWTENTYAGIWYNESYNFKSIDNNEEINDEKAFIIDEMVKQKTEKLLIYQKAIVLIIFGSSILVMIKYRNNLTNEMILLIIVFVGGFLFHILWEAKSRYIISYILILIPFASVCIENWKEEKEKIKKIQEKWKK